MIGGAATRVILVRHGATEWSVSGKHTGRTDLPLTAEGRRMAALAGKKLAEFHFSLVLTSPLQRARETCILAGYGGQAETRPDLMEWDYGAYEGLTTADIHKERPTWNLWRDGAPAGETAEMVGERTDRVIAEARSAGGDVALFAHGHLLRVLCARWLDLAPSDGRLFALDTAAISMLGYERDQAVISHWNQAGHLH
ncbi:MAG TPA: histidine phosphatase family protein [Chloroflexota bacterium]|nr:histidine phosphatase family protein [Chloroflexota bacterium]